MSMHQFDIHMASEVGVNAAVLYQNIKHWCAKNAANGKHQHDGQSWCYNSVSAFTALFPYLTTSQVRTALTKLIEGGFIVEGNYNKTPYDRTKWYCVSEQSDLLKAANGVDEDREPIPIEKPHSKPEGMSLFDDDQSNGGYHGSILDGPSHEMQLEQEFESWWKYQYPDRKGSNPKQPAKAAYLRARKTATKEAIWSGTERYFEELSEEGKVSTEFVAMATTFLNQRRWEQ